MCAHSLTALCRRDLLVMGSQWPLEDHVGGFLDFGLGESAVERVHDSRDV